MLADTWGCARCCTRRIHHCPILWDNRVGLYCPDLVGGARAMGLQAEILPVFGRPAAIEALMQQAPFGAMIDLASLYGTTPMLQ